MTEKKQHTNEFREGVVEYVLSHPDETIKSIAKKFGVSDKIIYIWRKKYLENRGQINLRGSGNHASDEAKELAKLKKENQDLKDALEVLKKAIGIVGT